MNSRSFLTFHRLASIAIRALGFVALFLAVQLWFWWRALDPNTSPTGYMFGVTFIPAFVVLSIGLFLRRFWAGFASLILLLFAVHDVFTGPRAIGIGEIFFVLLTIFVAASLCFQPDAWIRRF